MKSFNAWRNLLPCWKKNGKKSFVKCLTNHCILKWWRRINFRVWVLCCVWSKSLGMVRMGTNLAFYLFYWKYLQKTHSYAINSWQFKNKPTYHSSLSHVVLADYLGYAENFLKGKKLKTFTTFFIRLQLPCDAILVHQELL